MIPKKLLIIGFVWPEPKSSAAGTRMMQLIDIFQLLKYQITFASACAKTQHAFNLGSLGIEQVTLQLNSTTFDYFIRDLNPDIVIFDRFMIEEQFGWRVAKECPNALRILDTEDLHCLRKGRGEALKRKVAFDKSFLFNDIAKREIASIYRCDLTLIISAVEMEMLQNHFNVPAHLLCYLPFLLNPLFQETMHQWPKFSEREHFITIGNFLHAPNYDAVVYLKELIWPLIKKQLPKAEMHVYGAYTSDKVIQLHNKRDGFLIKGFINNVGTVMRNSKVCLAPLRFGAGLKGKLIDAMSHGTPCLMTSLAAEGMFGDLEPNGFIAEHTEDFALKAVELYSDELVWKTKQKNGFQIINTRFNKAHFIPDFIYRFTTIQNNLYAHRLDNFTGQMLQHHTMQSTKYMSKWIEEKNS